MLVEIERFEGVEQRENLNFETASTPFVSTPSAFQHTVRLRIFHFESKFLEKVFFKMEEVLGEAAVPFDNIMSVENKRGSSSCFV